MDIVIRHIHDCEACEFLATVVGPDPFYRGKVVQFDLYFCPDQALGGSLIARYDSEGPAYLSTARDILKHDLQMHPALLWAEALIGMGLSSADPVAESRV